MKTKIEKNFHVDHPIDLVWENLSDPTKVVTCVQGAELTEKVDDKNYKGKVSMKFGPVSAKYDGAIVINEMDNENYNMVLTGQGTDSRGKGGADMIMHGKLKVAEGGGTDVEYSMEVSVTGMLAQFGSRLIGDVSNQLANKFVESFKAKLDGETPSEKDGDNSLNTAAIAGSIIKDKLSGLFGSKKKDDTDGHAE